MDKKNIILGVGLIVVIFTPSYYFYHQYQLLKNEQSNSTTRTKNEVNELVKKVGKLVILPEGEEPTIATVSDIEKIKNQQFFTNARDGDKVLIYSKARKAILYNPFLNKIIEIGPLVIPTISVATESSKLEPIHKTTSLAIYNGTKMADLANITKNEIVDHIKDVSIIKTGNSIGDYQETQLFDVSGKNTSLTEQIRAVVDGTIISALPEEEASAGADIVIFVGQ